MYFCLFRRNQSVLLLLDVPVEENTQCTNSTLGGNIAVMTGTLLVTIKKGGGTRMMEYNVTEDMSLETIIERGAKFFFPQGKASFVN